MLNKDRIKRTIKNIDADDYIIKEQQQQEPVEVEENIITLDDTFVAAPTALQECIICQEPKIPIGYKTPICNDCIAKLRKLVKGVN